MKNHIVKFEINHVAYELEIEARKLLSDVIREDCFLTGTHIGCEHGVCGACTVLVDGRPLRSCLTYGVQMHGKHIETIESIGSTHQLSRFQQAMHEEHGLQCGFCTPGMLVRSYRLLQENPNPTEAEIRAGISGNLCRCTGYQNIVKAVQYAAKKLQETATA